MSDRKGEKSLRGAVLEYAWQNYKTRPDHPWIKYPDYEVLRHEDNRKWFGVIMTVLRKRLGLDGEDDIDILNVKCDPMFGAALKSGDGFFPAYHMQHDRWITVLLDGTVAKEKIFPLIDMSFDLTSGSGKSGGKTAAGPSDWIIPANPKYYDVGRGFAEHREILWKQRNKIFVGDDVYLYMTAPIQAILYKCEVTETDIPYTFEDGNIKISRAMKIRLIETFAPSFLPVGRLKTHGVSSVRSPRRMPASLRDELDVWRNNEHNGEGVTT